MRSSLRWIAIACLLAAAAGCNDCDLTIVTNELPPGAVGVEYSFQLASHCGGDDWFIDGGTLAPGIGLNEDGLLFGVPTFPGAFAFTVGVVDFGSEEVAYKGLVLIVDEP